MKRSGGPTYLTLSNQDDDSFHFDMSNNKTDCCVRCRQGRVAFAVLLLFTGAAAIGGGVYYTSWRNASSTSQEVSVSEIDGDPDAGCAISDLFAHASENEVYWWLNYINRVRLPCNTTDAPRVAMKLNMTAIAQAGMMTVGFDPRKTNVAEPFHLLVQQHIETRKWIDSSLSCPCHDPYFAQCDDPQAAAVAFAKMHERAKALRTWFIDEYHLGSYNADELQQIQTKVIVCYDTLLQTLKSAKQNVRAIKFEEAAQECAEEARGLGQFLDELYVY